MTDLKFPISCDERLALLLRLLDDAASLTSEFTGGWSNNFQSAEEFSFGLLAATEHLRQGDIGTLKSLWIWFAPTCDWDNFVGGDGIQLGQKVYDLVRLLAEDCFRDSIE